MTASQIKSEFNRLSTDAKLELLFELWDELAQEPDAVSLTAEQKRELDRRYERHRLNPEEAMTWEEAKAQLP